MRKSFGSAFRDESLTSFTDGWRVICHLYFFKAAVPWSESWVFCVFWSFMVVPVKIIWDGSCMWELGRGNDGKRSPSTHAYILMKFESDVVFCAPKNKRSTV